MSPAEPWPTFLGLEGPDTDYGPARVAVLPVPYEATVSYAAGTANGPRAILEASCQVELFDEQLRRPFHQAGVTTLEAVPSADSPDEQMRRVYQAARKPLADGKFLLTLGGEHSITAPLVRAVIEQHGPVSVLQIDAHADLRDSYDGTQHSHAAVMRRVLEMTDSIVQVGIRSFSEEEFGECPDQIAAAFTPEAISADPGWVGSALAALGERVYVTVDIDGFDPSIAPGTGTPEPGGLMWQQVCELLRQVCARREVVAADIVEVMPIPGQHVTEFLAARLAGKLLAHTQMRPGIDEPG